MLGSYREPTLNPRIRKLIGMFALLGFVVLYVGAAVRIGEILPDHWAARLIYYAVVGLAWGAPVLPLISWMNREKSG